MTTDAKPRIRLRSTWERLDFFSGEWEPLGPFCRKSEAVRHAALLAGVPPREVVVEGAL